MRTLRHVFAVAFMATAFFSCEEKTGDKSLTLKIKKVSITDPEQILPIQDSIVPPILYQNFPSLENLTVDVSKEKFVSAVLPAILVSKYQIAMDRERLLKLAEKPQWSFEDSVFFTRTKERFRAKSIEGLIKRMQTHPNSIVLAQAAVESGWGQSRFFQEANNLFGIWSYRQDEPRIEASLTRGDDEVHLRKYEDISTSITDYFETIGRSRAYRKFRDARAKTDDISQLLPHLKNYSERGMEYVAQLHTIIKQNDFTRYDNYRLDPSYFVEE